CYTFRATDEFGCNYDTLVCFNVGALEDATFNYAQTAYCQNEANPSPVLTVTADGTFTSTAGLIIDVNSGEINLKSSTIGTYDVTYSTPGVGCVNTSTIQVEITGFPTAIMSGDATICEGETADIQIALTGTGPWAVVYNDGTSDNTVSGITSSPYVITTGTSGSYSLVSVSNAQCSGTTSGTADIVVNQQVSFSNVTATCGGGDYTVTFNLSGGDPGSYSVSGMDDGTITNPSAGVYLYTSDPIDAGTTNYTFDFEDDFQCNLATITGVKNCSCGATAMLSGGGETCAGDSVELIVDFTGDAPFDFTYTDGTTPVTVNGVPGLTYSFYIQVQGDYSLTAMSDDLCLGSASGSANVKINNAPTVSVNDFSICEGEPQTISATASILGGNYTWTPGVFAHSSSISVSPASTQYYYVDYKLNGCSGVDSSLVTVNPIPTVTVIDYTICANETQIITTTVDLAGGDYSWTPGSFGNVDEISVTPSVTTDYEVDYILDGCTSSDISTVTVVPGLTLNMTDVEICDGESAPVSGIGSPAGGSYQWNEPLAPIGSNTNSITVSPAVDTYYPLLYSFSGCTVLDSAFVKVNFVPTVTVADQTICEGSSATLVSVTDSSGGGYNWTPGPFNSPQITVSPSSTTTYDLVYRIGTCSASTSAQVIVDATLTVLVASETICEGDSVELFAVASPAGGVYDWLHNSATTQSVWVQPTVSSSFNVVYSFDGCVASTSGLVTVNPTPTIDADSDSPLCLGDDLNLTVTTDATDFDWSGPNGFGSIDQNPIVLSVTDLDSGQYYVTVTLNGCSKTDSTYVEVNTAFADFSVFEDEGCTPFNAVFTNESANSVTCTWDFGNGQTSSVCDATHVYTGSGTFNVSLTIIDDNGCAANESKPEFIYIESNPNANFSFAPDYLDVDDQTAQMINETSGAVSYNWVFPDGTSTIEESPEHLFSLEEGEEGVIWLYAYSPLGCVDSVSKIIETTQPLIFFIPNSFTPDGDIFNNTWRPVMTAGFEPDRYQVSVYNRWGELVFRTEDSNEGWDGSAKNSNEKSADGIYTYVVVFTVSENDERKQYSGTISLNR
ncbi:MAG: gliding motility-associated-like protein, partial [Lentimonas sp.]